MAGKCYIGAQMKYHIASSVSLDSAVLTHRFLVKMPRNPIPCPLCEVITARPSDHLRRKHSIPAHDVKAMIDTARTKYRTKLLSAQEVKDSLPSKPTLVDFIRFLELQGYTITGKEILQKTPVDSSDTDEEQISAPDTKTEIENVPSNYSPAKVSKTGLDKSFEVPSGWIKQEIENMNDTTLRVKKWDSLCATNGEGDLQKPVAQQQTSRKLEFTRINDCSNSNDTDNEIPKTKTYSKIRKKSKAMKNEELAQESMISALCLEDISTSQSDTESDSSTNEAQDVTDENSPEDNTDGEGNGDKKNMGYKYIADTPRAKKQKRGLYHEIQDTEDSVFVGYRNFLKLRKGVVNEEQIGKYVKDISWLLAFCQRQLKESTDSVNLQCLTRENFGKYLDMLKECGLKGTSRKNVHKALNQFIAYIETCTNLNGTNPEVFEELKAVGTSSFSWQTSASRDMLREESSKRFKKMNQREKTPFDCRKPVREGDAEARRIASGTGPMTEEDHIFLTRYCMAVIICQHGQRPGVPENFTTAEYLANATVGARKVFTVEKHKTGAYQPACFSLALDHFLIFEGYHSRVQSTIALKAMKSRAIQPSMRTHFFIRYPQRDAPVKKVNKASQEMRHFQKNNLKLPKEDRITATQCRIAIQTAVKHRFDENEKKRFDEYLAHSGRVANRHYRMVQTDEVAKTGSMLDNLFSPNLPQNLKPVNPSNDVNASESKAMTASENREQSKVARNRHQAPVAKNREQSPEAETSVSVKVESEGEAEQESSDEFSTEMKIYVSTPPKLKGEEGQMESRLEELIPVSANSAIPALEDIRTKLEIETKLAKKLQSRWAYRQRKLRQLYIARTAPSEDQVSQHCLFQVWKMNENDITGIKKLRLTTTGH